MNLNHSHSEEKVSKIKSSSDAH
jgi:hypothetical protein